PAPRRGWPRPGPGAGCSVSSSMFLRSDMIKSPKLRWQKMWRAAAAALLCAGLAAPAMAERIKDLATIQGVRSNPLVGYGLVVGLDGTGDQVRQTPFTQQSLTNMLSQLGITVPQGTNMQVRNVAAVMVTANLPAFAQPGQTLDVVRS